MVILSYTYILITCDMTIIVNHCMILPITSFVCLFSAVIDSHIGIVMIHSLGYDSIEYILKLLRH